MTRIKAKVNENIQVNFSNSPEIAYWSRKYNIAPDVLQRKFDENGKSISRTIAWCQQHSAQQAA